MVDVWIHGHTEPSQDGCNKFIVEDTLETPGGAANAANCLSRWDVKVDLFGYQWRYGDHRSCPVKTRYMEDGKILFRTDDDGPNERGQLSAYAAARQLAFEMLQHADAVLLSDYDKGFLLPGFIKQVSDVCRERKIPCVADCKREPEVYEGCIRKGNREWFSKFGQWTRPYVTTWGRSVPVIDGWSDEESTLKDVKCVNHVGAGDCFAAHLTLALAYGFFLKEAAGVAHSAGRVYVQAPHNEPPEPEEVGHDMSLATE